MTIRVIGGSARGRKLRVPPGLQVRPSSDRVREALFNILNPRLIWSESRCLDLFAGAGSLGIEALSRGAYQACFVEQDRRVIRTLTENLAPFGAQARLIHSSAARFLSGQAAPYNIIFLDRPYGAGLLAETLGALPPWLAPGALICVEHPKELRLEEPTLSMIFQRRYGRTKITIFSY